MKTNQSGMVLVTVVILAMLSSVLASGLFFAGNSQIARTRRQIKFEKAFHIAEAGIEHAKAELRNSYDGFNDELVGIDNLTNTADDGVLSFGNSVSFGSGFYNVSVTDNNDSDASLFVDTDETVIVWSTGTYQNVQRVLEVAVCIPDPLYPPESVDGAMALYGTNGEVVLQGAALVDGGDYNVPDNFLCSGSGCLGTIIATNPAVPGVFSSTTSSVVSGSTINGNPPTDIGGSGDYTEQDWRDMVQELIPLATITIDWGTISGNETIGTRDNPEIAVITADLVISGNADGAGIMIITEGVNLTILGTFHYEGIIILMGDGVDDAAIEFAAGGNATIFGGIVGIGSELDIEIQGSPQIVYSTEALANLTNLQLPPNELSVVYWHEIK